MKKHQLLFFVIFLVLIGITFASEELIEWKPGKIQLDSDGHYRGPALKLSRGKSLESTVEHRNFGQKKPDCQNCHNNPDIGYFHVSSEKFKNTQHYKAMVKQGRIQSIQQACLICHVDDKGAFIAYPGDNLYVPEPFDIKKVSNDNSHTCGKCHKDLTERNKDHIMCTAKGHYYRSEIFPYKEALNISADKVYTICSVCHTSCASSCHMIGKDKQAVEWTFIQPFLDHKVGTFTKHAKIKVAQGVEMDAVKIREYLVGTYMKGGGPGYRMLAKMGKAPLETVKIDIESHELVLPGKLDKNVADDMCLRCHTCMVNPLDRLNTTLAHQSIKCVDCHRDGDVHGHSANLAHFAYEAVDASCRTCHEKEDIYRGKAKTLTNKRKTPIVNPIMYEAAPSIPPVKGAHEKVSCEVCHSEGIKQCNECHVGDLFNTVGDTIELGKDAVFFGKDKNGIVRHLLIHEIFGNDGRKYGGWIMKHTVHSLKKDAYTSCETCHTDPLRMGITSPELKLINTYLLSQAGVSQAYIKKDDHYRKVHAPVGAQCTDCHSPRQGASKVMIFHQAVRNLKE
jgi:hypothetical protein